MKVEYINPFLAGASSVLEMVLGETPVKQSLSAQATSFTSEQCNVVCGVTGQAQGQVIYGMSLAVADKIASHMLGEPPHPARIVASCRASDLPSGSATFLCHVDLLAGLVHSQGPFLPTTLCHVHLYGRFLHLGAPFLPTTFCHVDLIGRWSRAPFTVPPFATLNY